MEPTLQQFIDNTKFTFIDVNPEDFDKRDLILDFFGFENAKYGNTDFYKQGRALTFFKIFPTVRSSTITIDSKQFIWNMRVLVSNTLDINFDSEELSQIAMLLEDVFISNNDNIMLYHDMNNYNLFITYIGYI